MNIFTIFIGFEAKYAKSGLALKLLVHVVKVLLYDISYIAFYYCFGAGKTIVDQGGKAIVIVKRAISIISSIERLPRIPRS